MNQPANTYPESLPLTLQKQIRDILSQDPYFAAHRVRILLQDEGEIATMIAQSTMVLEGPVLVVAIASIEANPPSAIFSLELIVTEHVLSNRSQAGFDTALNIAWHAAALLSQDDNFCFDGINHFINGEGLFQAVAKLRY